MQYIYLLINKKCENFTSLPSRILRPSQEPTTSKTVEALQTGYLFGEAVLQVCVVPRAVRVGGVRRPDGHTVGEVGLRLRLLLRLPLVEGILQSHVGQNDAACHATLGRRASEALKVLVHAILPEGRLNGPGRPATYKGAAVLPLQHLHLGKRANRRVSLC